MRSEHPADRHTFVNDESNKGCDMDLPKKKKGPKLPPKPEGGGAAGRQRQFNLERGLGKEGPRQGRRTGGEPADDSATKDKPK